MSDRITRSIAAYRKQEPHAVINRAAMNAALAVAIEDCAKVCDEYGGWSKVTAWGLASKIRDLKSR